jgi:DNA-binding transcriptional ArsR family regulator
MSVARRSSLGDRRTLRARAPVFAALGDETRLALVARLSSGAPRSIAQLTEGSELTRQAITKHLRVLEGAGLVHCSRHGRESRYELDPRSLESARRFLEEVSAQWDQALARLKAFVEDGS